MKDNINKQKGFTIIEVLIVLAIAGLILLVVFLAVPALQRNSRNTRRKQDVSAALGALSEYSSNNNGALPTDGATFYTASQNFKLSIYAAPTGGAALGDFVFTASSNTAVTGAGFDTTKVYVKTAAKCTTSGTQDFGGSNPSSRNVAVVWSIETGGGTQSLCSES